MTEPTLDDHLAAMGAGLEQGRARSERRRRQLAAGAGLAMTTIAVGLGALVAIPGGRELDPVAEARAALDANGGLLHYVVLFQSPPPEGSSLPQPDPEAPGMAVWTATAGPERYRIKVPADGRPTYCGRQVFMLPPLTRSRKPGRRLTGVSVVAPTEQAMSADGTATTYSPFSQAIVVTEPPPASERGGVARPSAGFMLSTLPDGSDLRDPVRAIREALAQGRLRDDGIVSEGGRRLRRLVGELPPALKGGTRPTQLIYLVDAESFVPVELRSRRWATWSRAGGRDHNKWLTNIDRFKDFERLPDTAANSAFLKIDPPAGTTEIRIEARNRLSPTPLPKRFSPMGDDQAAQRRCEASRP